MKKESQTTKLLNLLLDGKPHRTDEIQIVVYGRDHLGTARISGRISELKARGVNIIGWHDDKIRSLFWYQIAPELSLSDQAIEQMNNFNI